jgi:hypothetical protein
MTRPRAPRDSRARDVLIAAITRAEGAGGWAEWADVRDQFRATYEVRARLDLTPDRQREARKRALSRAWADLADRVEIDRRPTGDWVRLVERRPP